MPLSVLVHSCFRPYAPVFIGSGKSMRICHERVNSKCSCSGRISVQEREQRAESGDIFFLTKQLSPGAKPVPDMWEVVAARVEEYPTRPLLSAPRALAIPKSRIERAYGIGGDSGEEAEATRIEIYGELGKAAGMMAWREDVREAVLAGV